LIAVLFVMKGLMSPRFIPLCEERMQYFIVIGQSTQPIGECLGVTVAYDYDSSCCHFLCLKATGPISGSLCCGVKAVLPELSSP
jgi:hypothetical protein